MRGHRTTPPALLLLAGALVAACWGAQARKVSRCEWVYAEDNQENDTSVCLPASNVAPLHLKAYQTAAGKGNIAARINSKFSALALWQGGGFYYAFQSDDGGFKMGCPPFDNFPSEADNTLYDQLELAECPNGAGVSGLKLSEAMACQYVNGSCNDACGCVTMKLDSWDGAQPACVAKRLYARTVQDTYGNMTLELKTNFTTEQAGTCAQYTTPKSCNNDCTCVFTTRSKCIPKELLSTGLTEEQLQMAADLTSVWADNAIGLNWDPTGRHEGYSDKEVGCCKNRDVLNAILHNGPGKVPGMTPAMKKAYAAEDAFCAGFKAQKACEAPQANIAEGLLQTWVASKSAKANVNCTAPA